MEERILQTLNEIERKENVKILHCVESGSRAWGFASPDSDYDVRFVYVRKKNDYLKLNEERDVIEWQLDDVLDVNGWDLKKALKLLYKSNPTLFEWNSSPIVYKTTDEWNKIASVIEDYFIQKSGLYHYLSTAKSNYKEFLTKETVKYKKYFYVLRPVLACKWILAKGTPPPMLFSALAKEFLDEEVRPEVDKLLFIKMNAPEIAQGSRIEKLNEYLLKSIEAIGLQIKELPPRHGKTWNDLNEIFIDIIG